MCEVLTALDYLEGDSVTERGSHLRRIYSEMDLVAAESMRHGLWDDLSPSGLAAALSVLVFESRRPDDASSPRIPGGGVREVIGEMVKLWGSLDALEREHKLDFLRQPDLGFAWVAYRWAEGDELDDVLSVSDLAAGDFVRWMKQLIDLAGQVADAAGASPLRETAREAIRRLRRGVVAYSALADEDVNGYLDRYVAVDQVPLLADGLVHVETAATTAATSARVTSPRATSGPSETCPVAGSSVSRPGPDDRPGEPAVAQRRVGVALGLDVRPPDVAGVLGQRVVDVDRGDLHEPVDAGLLRAGDRLERSLEVDGALALDVAVRAATGSEHHGAAALEGSGERVGVLGLDVEQAHLSAAPLELLAVLLLAHQRHGVVVGTTQHVDQLLGHLSVAPDDRDSSHANHRTQRCLTAYRPCMGDALD